MAKKGEFQVAIRVVGTSGKPEVKTVDVSKKVFKNATLADMLKKAGIDTKHKDFLINGQPATLKTAVAPDAQIDVIQIDVVERPRGS